VVRKDDIKLVDDIVRRLGLSQDQRKLLHLEMRYYDELNYKEIEELGRQIKQDFPNK
jgi:hypothetical protein